MLFLAGLVKLFWYYLEDFFVPVDLELPEDLLPPEELLPYFFCKEEFPTDNISAEL